MNVREDLLTDLVATLYKDDARIKQLIALVEAAYKEGAMLDNMFSSTYANSRWSQSHTFKQLQALKE